MDAVGFVVVLAIFVAAVALYFLPAIIAAKRDHHQADAIGLLNLFLGWTFLGWVVALVWSATEVKSGPTPESPTHAVRREPVPRPKPKPRADDEEDERYVID